MNLPNKLTILRVILVPVLVVILLSEASSEKFVFALVVFLLASYTDHLDGKLARKLNKTTDFGKFADPIADKILVLSIFVCFVQLKFLTAVPVIIIIFREFFVTSMRIFAAQKHNVIAANFWGKTKTCVQFFSISLMMVICACKLKDAPFWCEFFAWISAAVSVFSGIIYIKDNINKLNVFNKECF